MLKRMNKAEQENALGGGIIGAALGFLTGATVAAIDYGVTAVVHKFQGKDDGNAKDFANTVAHGAIGGGLLGAVLPEP
jgi:Na+-driven multidrug efflux pump